MDALPEIDAMREKAAIEAVHRLALLKPQAVPTLIMLMANSQGEHPRTSCSAFRKQGTQLSDDEKRTLKIRVNASMSRCALGEISTLGMADPIRAHELSLLRASFAIFRHRNAKSTAQMMLDHPDHPIEITYEIFHPDACDDCNARHGSPVPHDWGLFAPDDCTCITAPYGLHVTVDFFASLVAREEHEKQARTGSFRQTIKALFQRL